MRVVSALETDISLALRALNYLIIKGLTPHEALAAWLGAPAHQRVFIYLCIAFE
jgi:hypothetical protein